MTSLPDLDHLTPEQLRALAAQLMQRVGTLDQEVDTLGKTVDTLGKTVETMGKKIHHDKTLIEKLTHEIALLKRDKYGRSAERSATRQLSR